METSRAAAKETSKDISRKIIISGELLKNIDSIPDIFKHGKVEIKRTSIKKDKKASDKKASNKKALYEKYVDKVLKEVEDKDVVVYTLEEFRAMK